MKLEQLTFCLFRLGVDLASAKTIEDVNAAGAEVMRTARTIHPEIPMFQMPLDTLQEVRAADKAAVKK